MINVIYIGRYTERKAPHALITDIEILKTEQDSVPAREDVVQLEAEGTRFDIQLRIYQAWRKTWLIQLAIPRDLAEALRSKLNPEISAAKVAMMKRQGYTDPYDF